MTRSPQFSGVWLLLAACVSWSSLAVPSRAAESKATYDLRPAAALLQRVEADLVVGGDLKFKREGKIQQQPLSVTARLRYDERRLSKAGEPPRAARYYEEAQAIVKVDQSGVETKLDPRHRLIVAERRGEEFVLFCPQTPLDRDALDLIEVLGNSLVLGELLPTEPIALGGRWKQSEAALKGLLDLDAIGHCDVESTLTDVKDQTAEVLVAGVVQGATSGVATDLQIKAKYQFDLQKKQIVSLTLAVKEQRNIGHIGPGLDVVAKLMLRMTPVAASEQLTDVALKDLVLEATDERLQLVHHSEAARFRFLCDRRWHVTGDDPGLVVLRMVERGDLIAQCNISPVTERSAERKVSLQQYQIDVQHSLGKSFGKIISSGEGTDEVGHLVYRVVVQGEVEQLPIEWRYYLVHHSDGRRVALAFTVEKDLADRLGTSDREIVGSLRMLEPAVAQTNEPAATR